MCSAVNPKQSDCKNVIFYKSTKLRKKKKKKKKKKKPPEKKMNAKVMLKSTENSLLH